ncbi:hypothetical protein ODZ84_11115 [Chryseobacterium fluminis]|uniref:hypothetical protein n=1 Tax=Chryseobacterium fluminis TaxID=2983606 RepID=UPI00225978C5|nr:hypothetical protein [Chryseobacterium sp. MMS21-Ot14]UZU00075.1 hypothetical protein ODZ84_11115 [Chryseobacterium sp. MMS21-Ot14]
MCKCDEICIPKNLHWDMRPTDENFENENLYRRVRVPIDQNRIKEKEISAIIFPIKDDSCNREKYSKPIDVLYNINAKNCDDHFFNCAIVGINSNHILPQFFTPEGSSDIFTFQILHSPVECMYPHCEVIVFKNNTRVSDNKPKSVKAFIRDVIIKNCIIIKDFDINENSSVGQEV